MCRYSAFDLKGKCGYSAKKKNSFQNQKWFNSSALFWLSLVNH